MKRIHYFILLLFVCSLGFSQPTITLTDQAHVITQQEFQVIVDTTAQLSFEEIRKTTLPAANHYNAVENINYNYWIKIKFQNPQELNSVFEILTPQTESITFYKPTLKGYQTTITGHLKPYSTREFSHKNFLFDISDANYNKPFYIKINSTNKVGFVFKTQSYKQLLNYSLGEYWFLGFYYGFLALLILYHLVLYFVIRQKVYLFYSLIVLVAGLMSSSDDGLGIIYIWYGVKSWSQSIGLHILPIAYLLAFTLYSTAFLKRKLPTKGKKIIWLTTFIYIGYFIIRHAIASEKLYFSPLYVVPFLVVYGVAFYVYWQRKYKSALFFLIGFSFSLFGLIVTQLRLLGIIPGTWFTVYAFNIGVMLEFLSLAFSLGYKFKEEQRLKIESKNNELRLLIAKRKAEKERFEAVKEQERVTAEINIALEEKVNLKTRQLNDLVARLKTLNIEYDKENWDLRRYIKKEKESKLKQEKLTLKELLEIYPNNYKCYEFLSNLKWQNDQEYICPKCNHPKYSVNKTNFSRKCSRCSTAISATKDSIFESQKLPLTKLFYLAYLWNSSNKINVKDLSNHLKISENSIYNFIKKLEDRKKEKHRQKIIISTWVDLIF